MMNEPVNKMELSEQNAILQKAKITKGDLPELLEKKGISYDALRYEEYCDLPQECLSPIETLDSIEKCSDNIPAVSFFSGAGGFDVGFSYAGFENIISIEFNEIGRVDRLDPRLPSKTVIAGGTKGGGRSHLHPFVPRTLSVRECARLQTFPDDYIFTGANARQFTQVGNAVPPLLAYKLALAIKHSVFLLPQKEELSTE